MDRKLVRRQINACSIDELEAWRTHAVKCLEYYLKYPNEYEVGECNFVISHIDQRLEEIQAEKNV